MAEEYGWCKDFPVVDYREKGKHYCVFHAPEGKKGILLKEFNNLVFKRIKDAKTKGELCNLSGTIFEGDISFREFNKDNPLPEISFLDAIFSGETIFSGATFNKDVNFEEARFDKEIYFFETIFKGEVNFSHATFSYNAFFESARFSNETAEANFEQVIFNKMAIFHNVMFQEEADFSGTTFNGEARFVGTRFDEKTSFSGAIFSKKADFRLSTFLVGLVSFLETTFEGVADFSGAIFYNKIDFQGAKFSKEAYFSSNIKGDHLITGNLIFSARMGISDLSSLKEERLNIGPFIVGGNFIDLKIKGKIRFEEANLEKVSFLNTDLRMIDFISCKWPKEKNERYVLYDEIELFKNKGESKNFKEKIKKVEILYRKLKQKYKEEHDEQKVSNWHYGEKEMQRKGSTWKGFSFYLLHLYWLSSGYGERPVRAGITLSLLIIIISILFGLTGIKFKDSTIEIKKWSDILNWDYLKATIESATFESKPNFIPENWFLKIAAKLLIPLQAALFALALRNRFRR